MLLKSGEDSWDGNIGSKDGFLFVEEIIVVRKDRWRIFLSIWMVEGKILLNPFEEVNNNLGLNHILESNWR